MEYFIQLLVLVGAIVAISYMSQSKPFRALFAPKWVKNMPEIKDSLTIEQWSKLEILRNEYKITDGLFPAFVINSVNFTKIVLEKKYNFLRNLYPSKGQTEILSGLLYHHLKAQPDLSDDEREFDSTFKKLQVHTTYTDEFFQSMALYTRNKNSDLYETAVMKKIDIIIGDN